MQVLRIEDLWIIKLIQIRKNLIGDDEI